MNVLNNIEVNSSPQAGVDKPYYRFLHKKGKEYMDDFENNHQQQQQDLIKGLEYLQKALENGSDRSRITLAKAILKHQTDQSDRVLYAIKLLETALDKGLERSRIILAKAILKHQPDRVEEAIRQLETALDNGNMEAGHILADIYLGGQGVDVNKEKAIAFLNRCVEKGNHVASWRLTLIYLKDEDPSYMETMAKEGYVRALLYLGLFYYKSGKQGNEKDFNKAESTLEKVKNIRNRRNDKEWNGENGKLANEAKRALADIYYNQKKYLDVHKLYFDLGRMEQTDIEKHRMELCAFYLDKIWKDEFSQFSLSYLKIALNSSAYSGGNDIFRGQAFRDLGRVALRGKWEGVFRGSYNNRYAKAVKYWEKGSELGDSGSKFYLGIAYYTGRGVNRDKKRAIELLHEAKDLGHPLAAAAIDRMNGKNVEIKRRKKDVQSSEELNKLDNLDSLELKDDEIEDLIIADKPWFNRVIHWFKRNKGGLRKITEIALAALAAVCAVGGLIALTIFFPHVMVRIWIGIGLLGTTGLMFLCPRR